MNKEELLKKAKFILEKSGDDKQYEIVDVDPDIVMISLACKKHGEFVHSLRTLKGVPPKGGKRCPQCDSENGKNPRERKRQPISFDEAKAAAAIVGYMPEFDNVYLDYSIGAWKWVCMKNREHFRICSIWSLGKMGCPECKHEIVKATKFEVLKEQLESIGHQVLSDVSEYKGALSPIEFKDKFTGRKRFLRVGDLLKRALPVSATSKSTEKTRQLVIDHVRNLSIDSDFKIVSNLSDFQDINAEIEYTRSGSDVVQKAKAHEVIESILRFKINKRIAKIIAKTDADNKKLNAKLSMEKVKQSDRFDK